MDRLVIFIGLALAMTGNLEGQLLEQLGNFQNPGDLLNAVATFESDAGPGCLEMSIAAGAKNEKGPIDAGQGAVHMYEVDSIGNQLFAGTLHAADGEAGDEFGHSVAFVGQNTLVVGAPGYDVPGIDDVGAIYVFDRQCDNGEPGGGWVQRPESPYVNPKPAATDRFGWAISAPTVNDGTVESLFVVGAPWDEGHRGSVWVFDANPALNDMYVNDFSCPDDASAVRFGFSVSANINHNSIFGFVAGAPVKNHNGLTNAGAM